MQVKQCLPEAVYGEVSALRKGTVRRNKLMISTVRLIVALWAVTVEGTQAQELGNVRQGLRLARAQCAECHLVEKVAGRSTNAAAPTFEHIANVTGMTRAAFTAALRTSHETMPNVIIKGSDFDDLVAYILSLKNSD
ncbi:MAG: cytochrome c [Xanthobacteraceae bacterium]